MKTTKRNLTSRDLKSRKESIIYEDGKPIYRVYERLGVMTPDDIAFYLRSSFNYCKY